MPCSGSQHDNSRPYHLVIVSPRCTSSCSITRSVLKVVVTAYTDQPCARAVRPEPSSTAATCYYTYLYGGTKTTLRYRAMTDWWWTSILSLEMAPRWHRECAKAPVESGMGQSMILVAGVIGAEKITNI
ncbi:unnamed protein product [Periconia digitata]|uniref:Uncharacterized protein n=1 Tax=Periconia digitata TaxID=1303443 RepID=A0A9W4UKA1_9PLEO|nr:unnamed protein product [Periconia digitata]